MIDPTSLTTASWTPLSASPAVYHTPYSSMVGRAEVLRELIEDGYWVKATGSRVTKDGWTLS